MIKLAAVLLLIAAAPCLHAQPKPAQKADEHKHEHKHEEKKKDAKEEEHEGHNHTAPHDGTLVVLGDHFAMLEVVIDNEAGTMTGYVLDGEAEKAVRIKQANIELIISTDEGKTTESVKLMPVASPLTGEKAGDTSEFTAADSKFKTLKKFSGSVANLGFKGETFTGIEFKFPEGNE